ncbi:MAG: hypothetical protein R2796_09490 [Chitinophagaceae bacterium]|nr:hypothetical protein [Chitinophagaceae bacterium]
MKTTLLFLVFLLATFGIANLSCKKNTKCEGGSYSKGYIIGFDPCTALSSNEKGYVIKFDDNQDTIVMYFNLPNTISIPSGLYSNYVNDFLFPNGYRNIFIINAKYHEANAAEKKIIFCNGLVYLGDFIRATKNKQFVLDCLK